MYLRAFDGFSLEHLTELPERTSTRPKTHVKQSAVLGKPKPFY
jgi:hypothetical protein